MIRDPKPFNDFHGPETVLSRVSARIRGAMADRYYFVRFRWWTRLDIERAEEEMRNSFEVRRLFVPRSDKELAIGTEDREELSVRADTLSVRLAPMRAVLFQREAAPFTVADLRLRERVLELYRWNRSTPLSLGLQEEPGFEVADGAKAIDAY
jgi:hypothetical protein